MCVLNHVALQLTEFLQLVGVNHGDRLLRLIRLGLLVLTKHLLLHLVLVVCSLLLSSLVHHHLLVKFSLVLLNGWVVGHHHALELMAPVIECLHLLLLLGA